MNIVCPIDCFTGYGITGYNIWKELSKLDNDLILFLIGNGNVEPEWDVNGLKISVSNQAKFIKNKPCLKIWHGHDFFMRPYGDSKYGGLSFFEIDKISQHERVSYNLLDTIITPSQWAKSVLINNNINKEIVVCPMGVDTTIFDAYAPNDKDNDKYVFINIGKWEVRKGHDILVDIFNSAFNETDNVELWMINHNAFLNENQTQEWVNKYKNSKLGDKIKIYPRLPTQKTLSKVIAYADCGIFPSRAEGWNNEAIEMMAMNKPLIITNFSAHTEYCNSDNSLLINIDSTVEAIDNIWFNGSGNWAYLGQNQVDQTIEHMRYVYRNNIKDNKKGLETATNLSWTKTAHTINSILC